MHFTDEGQGSRDFHIAPANTRYGNRAYSILAPKLKCTLKPGVFQMSWGQSPLLITDVTQKGQGR